MHIINKYTIRIMESNTIIQQAKRHTYSKLRHSAMALHKAKLNSIKLKRACWSLVA